MWDKHRGKGSRDRRLLLSLALRSGGGTHLLRRILEPCSRLPIISLSLAALFGLAALLAFAAPAAAISQGVMISGATFGNNDPNQVVWSNTNPVSATNTVGPLVETDPKLGSSSATSGATAGVDTWTLHIIGQGTGPAGTATADATLADSSLTFFLPQGMTSAKIDMQMSIVSQPYDGTTGNASFSFATTQTAQECPGCSKRLGGTTFDSQLVVTNGEVVPISADLNAATVALNQSFDLSAQIGFGAPLPTGVTVSAFAGFAPPLLVPEPSTLALSAVGLLGLVAAGRKRRLAA